ncbi:MAG: DedA family protein [Candidatus Paceibacterota bacterium]
MTASFLNQLKIFLENIILSFGYTGIFVATLIENLLPPIPSEIIIPFSGFLIREGRLSFILVLIATTSGALLGASIFYYLGTLLGETRIRNLFRRYGKWVLLSEKDFDSAIIFFNQHSHGVVFWARFMPGIRSLISIPAGVAKMNFGAFIVLTICGTVIWSVLLIVGGMYLGENWNALLSYIDRFEALFYFFAFTLVLLWFSRRFLSRKIKE